MEECSVKFIFDINSSYVSVIPFQFSSGKSSARIPGIVAQPNEELSFDSSLLAVLVCNNVLFLSSEKGFPMRKELEVEIVEDEGVCIVIPVVQVELAAHVDGRAKRSRPLSLPESRWAHQAE